MMNNNLLNFLLSLFSVFFILSTFFVLYRVNYRHYFKRKAKSSLIEFKADVLINGKHYPMIETKIVIRHANLSIVSSKIEQVKIDHYLNIKVFSFLFLSGIILETYVGKIVIFCHAENELIDLVKKRINSPENSSPLMG